MPFHVSESFLEAIHKPTGLELAYNMEENPVISNARDTTKLKDLSGNGRHGARTGTVEIAGKRGKARQWTAESDKIVVTGYNLDGFTGFAHGAHVRIANMFATRTFQTIICLHTSTVDAQGTVRLRGPSGGLPDTIQVDINTSVNGFQSLIRSFSFTLGAEYHIWVEWDGAFLRLYVDEVQQGAALAVSGTLVAGVTSMQIGAFIGVNTQTFADWIDEPLSYNRALTAAERTAIAVEGSPFIIPSAKIRRLSLIEADEDLLDEMALSVYNDDGEFRDHLGMGKEVKWYLRTEGDTEALLRWTGIVKKPIQQNTSKGRQAIATDLGDYVYEILTQRQVFETFINKDAGLALKESVEAKCPELDFSLIQTGAPTVDVTSDGDRLKDLAFKLARMAGYQIRGDELKRVGFLPAGSDDSGLTADYNKVAEVEVGPDDTKLANVIRVDGGEGVGLIEERTAQTAFANVSDTVRKQEKILTPKRKVKQVQIHTDPTRTASGDALVVRMQADDGTGNNPIAIGDATQDLVRKELPATFLAVNGLTTFLLPEHILGAGNEYWIIVESGSGGGQDIGVDGAGDITFRADFAFPIIEQVESAGSIAEFGRREDQVVDPAILTKDEAKDRAKLEIAKRSLAERVAKFEIRDPTLLTARPGQGVVLDLPDEGVAIEKFILHQRRWRLERAIVRVTWDLVEEERLLEAADVIKIILDRLQKVERRQLRSAGEEIPDIFLFDSDSYDYGDAATLTVDTVLGMVWDTDKWGLEVWSD